MPNIKSAKKRVLINQKKNDENRVMRSKLNNAIKKFNNAIDTNNIEEADKLLPLTMSIIDSCAADGVIHKNAAANKKSGIATRLSMVKSGKLVIQIKKDNKTIAAEKAKAAKEARDAVRAENAKKAAERQAAKLEEEKAKLEAEKAAKKKPAKAKAVKETKAEETVEAAEKPAPKKAAAKKAAPKKEEAKEEPKAE